MQNRLARHALRGADRPRAVAGVARRARGHALRQREVRAGDVRRPHRRLRLRVRRAASRRRSRSRARRPTTSAASSATARPSASAASSRAAVDLLSLNLPPDAAALLRSGDLAQDAFVLWDLVHDRAHSHGDLPFDPFMIRQRMPYWMYSLEELRCDLTAFGEAVELEAGASRSRATSSTRSSSTGSSASRSPATARRNYDGLGGQLLFAFLHREGHLHWTDNRLTIEWATRRRRRPRAARGGRGALPRGHRPLEARAVGRRARPRRALRPPGRGLALGRGRARVRRRRGPAAVHRRGARRRVPAVDVLRLAEGQARARRCSARAREAVTA